MAALFSNGCGLSDIATDVLLSLGGVYLNKNVYQVCLYLSGPYIPRVNRITY